MKQFTKKHSIELMDIGYTKLNLLNETEISTIIDDCESLYKIYDNNLDYERIGITYPSNKHDNKKSLIMMLSYDKNEELPSVYQYGDKLKEFIKYNNDILFNATGIQVPLESRYMINYRKYLGETEPVFEHFDGEYLKNFIDRPNYHFFDEALLPRFVSLLTLENYKPCEGPILINVVTGQEINPCLGTGDMLIFNNIKYKHSVPRLIKPRTMLGIRNFDFLPYHYILEPNDGYVSLGDKINYGYIKPIGIEESQNLIKIKLKSICHKEQHQ
jgi:hypothetical protein